MAYVDENGKITIDERAAQADIRRIESAIDCLNRSGKAITNLIRQASTEKGQTSTAVMEKAVEMRKQIEDMNRRLSETASFIAQTVSHYRQLDQKLKEEIAAATAAGNFTSKGGTQ